MRTLYEQEPTGSTRPLLDQAQVENQAQEEKHIQAAEQTVLQQKTGKRLVSKGRYAANVGKKAVLSSLGVGFLVSAGISTLLLLMMLYDLTGSDVVEGTVIDKGWLRLWTPVVTGVTVLLFFLATRTFKRIVKLDIGVPLTRANSADLPAPDSLVRASEEPIQAPETVLLRAATGDQTTSPDQLVRPID